MNQGLALEILLSGESAFITGAAGTGKTFLLNQFIRLAKSEGKFVSRTATTGLAATHIGGATIHSWSGIGVQDYLPNNFFDQLSKGRREIIEKTDILVIDEISMLHDYRFDMIDKICRGIRKSDKPFGGIQVVMSGDFFQLPPINRPGSKEGSFVVHSQAWQELDPVIVYLLDQHRQNDEVLSGILSAMRSGDLRRHHAESLLRRVEVSPDSNLTLTELHTVNIDVDAINQKALNEIDGDEVIFTQSTTGASNYVENLQRSVLAPPTLVLKKGALVMAVKNSPEKKYVNGSIGVVAGFERGSEYPIVDFLNGKTIVMAPDSWELRDGDKKRAGIVQVPLRLAWAITIHKSQGMTLDAAMIDLRKAFVEGMGYVALSRVRDIDHLFLRGINQMALRVSAEAQSIDGYLRDKSRDHGEQFAHLRKKAEKRAKAPPRKKPSSGSWQEKIEKMRKTHPNAYKPWQKNDDDILKEKFLNGSSIEMLSEMLGRHQGSIRMRLQKHFGEDMIQ